MIKSQVYRFLRHSTQSHKITTDGTEMCTSHEHYAIESITNSNPFATAVNLLT